MTKRYKELEEECFILRRQVRALRARNELLSIARANMLVVITNYNLEEQLNEINRKQEII